MSKVYKSAPLPFMGQKRFFVKAFSETLEKAAGEIDTVVDLFGGSGLLSHVSKAILPDCRVIYNDYDNYTQRLAAVDQTNEILALFRECLDGVPHYARIDDRQRTDILAIVERYAASGYVDFVTIGRSVLFSGKWAKSFDCLKGQAMYNNVRHDAYDCSGYLDGLEVVHMDYRELFERHKDNPRALFVVDPPYLFTEVGQYDNYWRLTDYLDVLKIVTWGMKYIYFTSSKSQILELCDWLAGVSGEVSPLYGATKQCRENLVSYNARYTDVMMVKL